MKKEEKNRWAEERKETDAFWASSENRKLLAAAAGLLVLLILILCGILFIRSKRYGGQEEEEASSGWENGWSSMEQFMKESLKKAGFDFLPEDEAALDRAVDETASLLERLQTENTDRETMVERVKEYLAGLGWELDETQLQELSEWLVDIYLENYETIQSELGKEDITAMGDALMDQMGQDLDSIYEYLDQLDTSVVHNKEILLSFTQNDSYEKLKNELNQLGKGTLTLDEKVSLLFGQLELVQNGVALSKEEIRKLLDEMNGADLNRLQELLEKFSETNNRLSNVRDDMNAAHDSLKALTEAVKSGSQKEHAQLLAVLNEMEQSFSEQNNTNYDTLVESLKAQTSDLAAMFDAMHQKMNQNQQVLSQNVQEVGQGVAGVGQEVEKVGQGVTGVGQEVEKVGQGVTGVGQEVGKVGQEVAGVGQEVGKVGQGVTEVGQGVDKVGQKVAEVGKGVTESRMNLLERLEAVEKNLTAKIGTVTQGMSGSQTELLERLAQIESSSNARFSGLDQAVQSVFQRVSNGKKLLASALLTKNVTVDEDASFREIHDGILNIKQQIVIGTDQLPGKIEYEYHHHTGSPADGGGCYTVPNIHQHVGSCYVVCQVDESGCHSDGNYNDNGMMHCPKTVRHSYCWNGETRWSEWVHPDDGSSHVDEDRHSEHLVTVCGKNAGVQEGWKTGCGLSDGQIIGAHIVYDAKLKPKQSDEALFSTGGKDLPPTPLPEEGQPPRQDEAAKQPESHTGQDKEETTEEGNGSDAQSDVKPEKPDQNSGKPEEENAGQAQTETESEEPQGPQGAGAEETETEEPESGKTESGEPGNTEPESMESESIEAEDME